MNIHELPMIIFTVVAQMSVGAFWALGAIQLLGRARKISVPALDRITDVAMYAVGPLLVAGFIAAFFHLNDPFHAIYTMNNLGSSWLSRELLAGVLFGGFGAAFAIAQWFGWFSRGLREVLAVLTALSGLFLIVAMAGVYYSTVTIPAWNTIAVPVFFFASALFTGPLAVAVALLVVWSKNPLAKFGKHGSLRIRSGFCYLDAFVASVADRRCYGCRRGYLRNLPALPAYPGTGERCRTARCQRNFVRLLDRTVAALGCCHRDRRRVRFQSGSACGKPTQGTHYPDRGSVRAGRDLRIHGPFNPLRWVVACGY